MRAVALRNAGARRLLTPEELAHKTAALTGYQWGRFINAPCWGDCQAEPNKLTDDFRLLYGGIDSDGITERARDITSVMSGVAKRHAVSTSCPAVLRELYMLPNEDRRLFKGVDKNVAPNQEYGTTFEIENENQWETYSLSGSLPEGSGTVKLSYFNAWYDHASQKARSIRLKRLSIRNSAGRVVASRELKNLAPISDCNHPVGDDHFGLHCNGSLDVPIEVAEAGSYTIEVVARGDQLGEEFPQLQVAVLDATYSGSGAVAIRAKLTELHDTLLGVDVTPYSPDVNAAFELLIDAIERGSATGNGNFNPWDCRFGEDKYFFDGILDDILIEKQNEWGLSIDFDYDRRDAYISSIDFSDAHYAARAWVVVLSYLLMDYRYLYL